MGPTWGPPGSYRPQMGPMLAPWALLSGMSHRNMIFKSWINLQFHHYYIWLRLATDHRFVTSHKKIGLLKHEYTSVVLSLLYPIVMKSVKEWFTLTKGINWLSFTQLFFLLLIRWHSLQCAIWASCHLISLATGLFVQCCCKVTETETLQIKSLTNWKGNE